MRSARMRERVALERRTDSDDGYGNKIASWAALTGLSDYPAQIKPLRMQTDDLEAGAIQESALVEIVVRSCAAVRGIESTDRIKDTRTQRVYNIRNISNHDMRHRYVTFVCEYGVADG